VDDDHDDQEEEEDEHAHRGARPAGYQEGSSNMEAWTASAVIDSRMFRS
jgi:hypothetical protein